MPAAESTKRPTRSHRPAPLTGSLSRPLPVGAEVLGAEGTHFRVWAPRRTSVEVVLEREAGDGKPHRPSANDRIASIMLSPEPGGYFSGLVSGANVGSLYRYRLDGEKGLYPDPASRFQPAGPHGPSQVIDPGQFVWSDGTWEGVGAVGQVLYELHIGTFTPEGTWAAAARELAELAALGVTCVEVMPIADFPGRFGWGYDGVNLFAPTRLYGEPDEFRKFVDEAHSHGIGVILDVVYNHFGPDGNYLRAFAEHYFSSRYWNEWGDALNFDGEESGPVREFFLANAQMWIDEYHLDGLRLDATQQLFDSSPSNIMKEIGAVVRKSAGGRRTFIVAENETQETRLVRSVDQGGYGLDALWNDDFHHSAVVRLTGHNEAYYTDYLGNPQEFISAAKWGYLYQGQRYSWQKNRRGTPALDLPPTAFVTFLENHDQVANSTRGERCHQLSSPGCLRAMTAMWLLGPGTPMLFQGQEFGSSRPFYYFVDHHPELARMVTEGRKKFMSQFRSAALPEVQALLADPCNEETFTRSKLDLSEREKNAALYKLHKDLLHLRRSDPVFREPRPRGLDGSVLGPETLCMRYFGGEHGDRLLIVNFGRDLRLDPAPEPLLAPPAGQAWEIVWSSEDIEYGGNSTPPLETEENWRIPGECAVVLRPGVPPEKQPAEPKNEKEEAGTK